MRKLFRLPPAKRIGDEQAPKRPGEPSELDQQRQMALNQRAANNPLGQQKGGCQKPRLSQPDAFRIGRRKLQARFPDGKTIHDSRVDTQPSPSSSCPDRESQAGQSRRHRNPRPLGMAAPHGQRRYFRREHEQPRPRHRRRQCGKQQDPRHPGKSSRRHIAPAKPRGPHQREQRAEQSRRMVRIVETETMPYHTLERKLHHRDHNASTFP